MPEQQHDMTAEPARGRLGPRLPQLRVTDLTPGQLVVYDAITTLVGYYATLALQLRVFRIPAPG